MINILKKNNLLTVAEEKKYMNKNKMRQRPFFGGS